jgi:trehalose/maltose hydrolase-like predicted phosphorylase
LPLDRRDQQFLLAQQFYLLCTYDGSSHPVGPIGLSGNMWRGNMMWDCDLWHFRALNALWPDMARQTVRARLAMLPEARRNAESHNLRGAWYGWSCDEDGVNMSKPHYEPEIHVNAWVALAAYESAMRSNNAAWRREVYPSLAGIADAVCSRAVRDDGGVWHLREVLPPDESVVENPANPGTCDDNVATNLAFVRALRAAVEMAEALGEPASPKWAEVAAGLAILPPGPDGIIPEYHDYNGHPIKQADLILAFYPLGLQLGDDVVLANLDYYREKVVNGPLMTEQVDACVRLQRNLGDRTAVLRDLIKRYRRYVHGAFEVPYECVDNSNSLMLTACGGLIATLVYGWFGVNRPEECNRANVPRIGGGSNTR